MNKFSKYRKLMDYIESGMAAHEIDARCIYQTMMETLDTAEEEEKALQAKLDAAEHDSKHLKKLIAHGLLCGDCNGIGVVGNAPDDYYDCPTCVARNNKADAATINKLIADHSHNANIDGVSEAVVYVDTALKFVDELLGEGK